jgi:hypothetical protein
MVFQFGGGAGDHPPPPKKKEIHVEWLHTILAGWNQIRQPTKQKNERGMYLFIYSQAAHDNVSGNTL